MQHVAVVVDHDELNQEVYQFWFDPRDATLYLDMYHKRTRPTRRHKFQVDVSYRRLGDRNSINLPENEVPLPDSVVQQALEEFRSRITVRRWSKRGK